MDRMLIAELLCSDEECAVTVEVVAEDLEELELLVCDECECILQTLSISEAELVEPALPAPFEPLLAA